MIGVGTVDVPEVPLNPDEVIIKNYSENVGIEEALQPAGILKEKVREVQAGYATVPVYKIDLEVLDKVTAVEDL